ncbi:MAG: hypothetical protein U1F58_08205 [Burkholderiales bacterium]
MFFDMIRALKEGRNGAKAVDVLRTNYNLRLDASGLERMQGLVKFGFADLFNEHSLAVKYLADYAAADMDPSNPKAIAAVTIFVKVAKNAKNRGVLSSDTPLEELCDVARTRFGIDSNKVSAA